MLGAFGTLITALSVLALPSPMEIKWSPKPGQEILYSYTEKMTQGDRSKRVETEALFATKVLSTDDVSVKCQIDQQDESTIVNDADLSSGNASKTVDFGLDGSRPGVLHLSDSATLIVFPKTKVSVGDTWTAKHVSSPATGGETAESEFKFEGLDPIGVLPAYRIAFTCHESENGDERTSKGAAWVSSTDGSQLKLTETFDYKWHGTKYRGEETLTRLDVGQASVHTLTWAPSTDRKTRFRFNSWASRSDGAVVAIQSKIEFAVEKAAKTGSQIVLTQTVLSILLNGHSSDPPKPVISTYSLGPRGQLLSTLSPPASAGADAETGLSIFPVMPDAPVRFGDKWAWHYDEKKSISLEETDVDYVYQGEETLGRVPTYRIQFKFTGPFGLHKAIGQGVVWLDQKDGSLVKLDVRESYVSFSVADSRVTQHSRWVRDDIP